MECTFELFFIKVGIAVSDDVERAVEGAVVNRGAGIDSEVCMKSFFRRPEEEAEARDKNFADGGGDKGSVAAVLGEDILGV